MSKRAVKIIVVVFLFSLVYAVMRYHIFEGVPPKDFALYVLNKCLALTAFILLTLTFTLGPAKSLGVGVPDPWLESRREIGSVSFLLALTHVFCSMLTFGSGGYYAKFFASEGGINAIGSWSMLLGVLSFVWLWGYYISFKTPHESDKDFLKLITSRGSLTLAALLSAGHVAVMGFKGWILPQDWPGGMPPITLVAFVVFLGGSVINLRGRW
jgi:hypothetical protein